jgi:glycosyltransferase involved in cell wall biosynthesis
VRITCITAGAGGMYCGGCARNAALARALAPLGCEVQAVPLYTPMKLDEGDPPGTTRTFFGGINVWLEQHVALWRRAPRFVRRMLDGRGVLNCVSKFAIQTRAEALGPMTVSVLKGENGRQAAELDALLDFLEVQPRPDVVNITNSLLSAIAPAVKKRLDVRISCELQGGDGFIAAMPEPYRSQARDLIRQNARDVDLFISPSEAAIPRAAEFLGVPVERIRLVRTGLDLAKYPPAPPRPATPFTIGYLSRITPDKGLDLLIEACRILAVEQARDVRLRFAGQTLDRRFWKSIRGTLRREGLESICGRHEVDDLANKAAFLQGCNAFSVPSRTPEVLATSVLEAMAAGAPAVVPDSGVFPEIVGVTGGGVLFPAGDARALADELARLMDEPERATALGLAARAGICEHYAADGMAKRILELYTGLVEEGKQR